MINEVITNDPGIVDSIELLNTGADPVDVSGWIIMDDNDGRTDTIAAGTILAPGGFLVLQDKAQFNFGLGAADSARIFDASGTLIDSFSWTAHSNPSWSRCPDGVDSVDIFAPGWALDPALAIQSYSWSSHAAIDGDTAIAANSRCPNVTGDTWAVAYATPGAFNDCPSAIRINEVESNNDATDWVEIVNAGTEPIDISGWTVMDNDPAGHAADVTPLAAGTVLAPGAYFVFDGGTHFSFGLGGADVASVRDAAGLVVAEYQWSTHAAVTYGRCPDTTGPMGDQVVSSKGAANNCDGVIPEDPEPGTLITMIAWPGSPDVTVIDTDQVFLADSSGLDFHVTDEGTFLWAIDNGTGTLFKLVANADGTVSPAPGWDGGKLVRFQKDANNSAAAGPDAEGVTVAGDGFIYVGVERDNSSKGVNYNVILKVDPNAPGSSIVASQEWDLTGSLPAVSANTGIEAVEWVPDSALAGKLWDTARNAPYDPANYLGNGGGLFLVAVENNGHVYAYALHADGSFALVSEIVPFLGGVMALDYDSELGVLWAVCDNGCEGTAAQVTFNGTAEPTLVHVQRPAGMPNLNNEGFATATDALCVGGVRPVWWFADGEVPAALRSGTLPCTAPETPTDPEPSPGTTRFSKRDAHSSIPAAPTGPVPELARLSWWGVCSQGNARDELGPSQSPARFRWAPRGAA